MKVNASDFMTTPSLLYSEGTRAKAHVRLALTWPSPDFDACGLPYSRGDRFLPLLPGARRARGFQWF